MGEDKEEYSIKKLNFEATKKEYRLVAIFGILLPVVPLTILIWGYVNGKGLIIPGVILGVALLFYVLFLILGGIRLKRYGKEIAEET